MEKSNYFEIRVEGNLSDRWADWFAGLSITSTPDNETIISGTLQDQADLHGVLMKIRDLRLVLISVNRLPQPDGAPMPLPTKSRPITAHTK